MASSKPESRLRTRIKEALAARGMSVHVYHASVYGETGHPDLYGTYRGRALFMEVKQEGWVPRNSRERTHFRQQQIWLKRESDAGAMAMVVYSVEDALMLLRHVDTMLDSNVV